LILKVRGAKDSNGEGWLFIDKLDALHERKKVTLTAEQYAEQKAEMDYLCMSNEPEEGADGTVSVAIVKGTRAKGQKVSVMFDTEAYICNDRGDTLEKVWAR